MPVEGEPPVRGKNMDGMPYDEIFDSGEVAHLGFVDYLVQHGLETHTPEELTPVSDVVPPELPAPLNFVESARRIMRQKQQENGI